MRKKIFFIVCVLFLSSVFVVSSIIAAHGVAVQKMNGQIKDNGPSELITDEAGTQEQDDEDMEKSKVGTPDEHDCYPSAGYRWCESKQKCLRVWEEDCPPAGDTEDSNNGQSAVKEQNKDQTDLGQTAGDGSLRLNAAQVERARNVSELKTIISEKKGEFAEEIKSIEDKGKQQAYQNQNIVREAVHTFLAAEDIMPGIGEQVSEIAREFNNSVGVTLQAEEKIRTRSKIKTFFFGGNGEAARSIGEQVDKNQPKIEELKTLKNECLSCQDEIRAILQEQIANMEQEHQRLRQLVVEEQSRKGIIGWIVGLFK